MKSLILTILYLAKDTCHRWFTHLSSPLARVLVVYFLGLCALCSLGSYALATKIVREKIIDRGGDLIHVTLYGRGEGTLPHIPTQEEISRLLDADSYALIQIGSARSSGGEYFNLFTYDFSRAGQYYPLMAASGVPTVLHTPQGKLSAGPTDITVQNTTTEAFVRILPENHLLMRLMNGRGILVQPENLPNEGRTPSRSAERLILRIRNMDTPAALLRAEEYMRNLMRLEKADGAVVSAAPLLQEMETVLSRQTLCRAAFCLGISCIVGILLTALAGMEYRRNEYIYTLMKSFGIHPVLLVGAFIIENLCIVGASFAAAVATFMHFQHAIVADLLKLGNYSLSFAEIMPEIRLISITLVLCVFISSLPIIAAAHRDIGRVLK